MAAHSVVRGGAMQATAKPRLLESSPERGTVMVVAVRVATVMAGTVAAVMVAVVMVATVKQSRRMLDRCDCHLQHHKRCPSLCRSPSRR